MAVQQDPYVALPSLYGAPAYSRPPRPPVDVERPLDPDDLPISNEQTEEERRLAEVLLAADGHVPVGANVGHRLPGAEDPGYHAVGDDRAHGASDLAPRRLSLRVLADRVRPRG